MQLKKTIVLIGIGILFAVVIGLFPLNSTAQDIGSHQTMKTNDGSGFVIIASYEDDDIYDVYERLKREKDPQFITTDLVLHTAHLLFDYSIRSLELEALYPQTRELVTALASAAHRLAGTVKLPKVDEAARDLAAYLAVSAAILNPKFVIPEDMRKDVKADLRLIEQAKGFAFSKTLPYREDFSRYRPRGHYSHNEFLKRYFKGMVWLGRLFRVEEKFQEGLPGGDRWDDEMMLREARQILLMMYLLESVDVEGVPAAALWERINEAVTLFSGVMDDLNIHDVQKLIKKVQMTTLLPADLVDEGKLRRFVALCRQATHPRIDASGASRKGFALLGQRFLPDSYVLQSLVSRQGSLRYTGNREPRPFTYGIVVPYGPVRTFPRGLDLAAAMGSEDALELLDQMGDTDYDGYPERMAALHSELPGIIQQDKDRSLFYGLLYALQPLLHAPAGDSLPGFFATRAWALKELNTALGAWAELRHDTVLYAKQSYTAVGSALVEPDVVLGYVEPYPELYRRVRDVFSKVREKFLRVTADVRELDSTFQEFDEVMGRLIEIAERELNGKALTVRDYRDISEAALQLRATTKLPLRIREKIGASLDTKMAVVTDVHTDNNSQMVLQEGVGTPFLIQVKIRTGNTITVFKGGILSYYEFKQPMRDRLTDEQWQKRIASKRNHLTPPEWLDAIID